METSNSKIHSVLAMFIVSVQLSISGEIGRLNVTTEAVDRLNSNTQKIDGSITFKRDIKPIFKKRCIRCHSNKLVSFGGLKLNSLKSIAKGGRSGPAVVSGNAEKSILYNYITSGRMPPKGEERIPLNEVRRIRNWINQGAN